MAITHFKPTIWSPVLLVALRKALIFSAFINRDYEGDIAEQGDSVRITSIGRPSIKTYTPNKPIDDPEQVSDSARTLVVDQAKYFNFAVDDVDARQAAGNVLTASMDEAAYGLADVVDQYIASFYTGIQAANQLGAIAISQAKPTDVYDKVLVPLKVRLDKASVPTQNRSIAVSPDLHGLLLRDDRFVRAEAAADNGNALRNGEVGRAAGFTILNSNSTPTTDGDDQVIIAGTDRGITFADQISKTEAYRPEKGFADAVKGLALYGGKVIRPDVLASAAVTVTA